MPKSNYFDSRKIDWTLSGLTQGILSRVKPDSVAERRRANYLFLQKALSGIPAIQLLYDNLPVGVCPLAFPFYVKNRNFWSKALENRGILVGGWPSYHKGFDWKDFPEARHLKNDLLTVPVHQGLGSKHMEHIVRCVKELAGQC